MPSYKTHSIHGEIVLPEIRDLRVPIYEEDMKSFCMGPDAMILTDYHTFSLQHKCRTKDYFVYLLRMIKEGDLQYNSEVMAFLYGQIAHFALDAATHPLIYYMTEDIDSDTKFKQHGLVENWIDDYICRIYDKNEINYYHKKSIKSKELKRLIDGLYLKVYGKKNQASKYNYGMRTIVMYDLARRSKLGIIPYVIDKANVGDIMYSNNIGRVLPYLNLEKEVWYNPETCEKYTDSFPELWDKSIDMALEMIQDVNDYLYKDKLFSSPIILNNTSYNTGLPCGYGQTFQYVKKYKNEKSLH